MGRGLLMVMKAYVCKLKGAVLYNSSFQFVEKVCFLNKSACPQSLSPNPFPRERGYITGATAPRPCRGLRPKARMLWLLAKSFARCKTNRASNKRHPILSTIEVFRQPERSCRIQQLLYSNQYLSFTSSLNSTFV